MFSKVSLLCIIAVATALPQHQQAHQFPAGVNPALCPGYPNCDNALLHNPQPHHQAGHWGAPAAPAAPHWAAPAPTAAPHWQAPTHAPHWAAPTPQPHWAAPAPQPHWAAPVSNHLPAGDKYPAGVNPQSCPNYPYCDLAAGAHAAAPQVAPLPGYTERQYPAGVSPHQCPNFPYCS